MGAEDFRRKKEQPPGAPAWMVTFSDMMTLLLCFFILLLTMSEMRPKKFKMASGSLRDAFGVNRTFVDDQMPKADNIVAQEFSQSPPTPVSSPHTDSVAKSEAEQIANALAHDEAAHAIEVTTENESIVITIRDHALFDSGSAEVHRNFLSTLRLLSKEIKKIDKYIVVSGHTDDLPIKSTRYRSNWDLSSARAVTVAEVLMEGGPIAPEKFTVSGYAETKPLLPNRNATNRAKNRRVEIILKPERP